MKNKAPNHRHRLTAVDLFSGAGGISTGLADAGYDVLLANDLDSAAAKTYRRNFPGHQFIESDAREITGQEIIQKTGLAHGELDLLIGGPPARDSPSLATASSWTRGMTYSRSSYALEGSSSRGRW